MSSYSQYLYVRTVNPNTEDQYVVCGSSPDDVADTVVGEGDSVDPEVARYVLAGLGTVHTHGTVYLEHASA